MTARTTIGLVVIAALFASPASATEVSWSVGLSGLADSAYLLDRDGESNSLDVAVRGRTNVRERGGAKLTADDGCRQRSQRFVTCPWAEEVNFDVRDGDDRVAVSGRDVGMNGFGGRGHDSLSAGRGAIGWLHGGDGRDVLSGGDERDRLFGDAGRDRLAGGPGSDILWGGRQGRGTDVLDGGRGLDIAMWQGRAVRVNLRARRAAGDLLRSIEGARGTQEDDRLIGTAGDNVLYGHKGADVLVGGAGDDVLGAGRWRGSDGARDRIRCGPGRDRVGTPGLDPLGPECERFSYGYGDRGMLAQPRELGPRRVAVRVSCRRSSRSCERRVALTTRGRLIGRSRLRRTEDSEKGYWMPVRLRRPLRGVVRISVTGRSNGRAYEVSWRIRR
jgi:Ca2+-binding RTX toxin-like protein